jgi:SAM-dependent methyltransferase
MTACRVCGETIPAPAYDAPAPALTSIMTLLDVPTRVFVCDGCGHAQCDDIPDIQAFYDTTYRISLSSADHDQVFSVAPDGTVLFRTDHQTDISLRLLDLPQGAHVLDYGAAKADTLRKMMGRRADIAPHVFDVSADYAAAWRGWVPEEAQATYTVPEAWRGAFDAVMSHFVIEHVPDPVGFLSGIAALLKPDGRALLSLPDVAANPGDMVVADHLNHFSEASLDRALARAGLQLVTLDRTSFPGAFFAVAKPESEAVPVAGSAKDEAARAREICTSWERATVRLDQAAKDHSGKRCAIYGAGFYGSWIMSRVGTKLDVSAFLDRNPHLVDGEHFGKPVIGPEDIPANVDVLFIGLNPLKARDAIAAQPWLNRAGLAHIWL